MNEPKMLTQKQIDHQKVQTALSYIESNLSKELSLAILSEIVHTSPFHFHRLFRMATGETLNDYIVRLRLEGAATMIKYSPQLPFSQVAYTMGFNSQANFSRVFQKWYGVSPSTFRKEMGSKYFSKICKTPSKNGKIKLTFSQYFRSIEKLINWMNMNAVSIEVKNVTSSRLLYLRHEGDYGDIGDSYQKLMNWAGPKGYLNFPKTKMTSVYLTSPQITENEKLISYAGITAGSDATADEGFELLTIPEGKCLVANFEIPKEEFENAWDSMLAYIQQHDLTIFPNSFFYETYLNDGTQHPQKLFQVEMFIPLN